MQGVTEDGVPDAARARTTRSRSPGAAAYARRRRVAVWHGLATTAILAVPVVMVLVVDFARRGSRIVAFQGFYRLTYVAATIESFLVWGTLLYAASRRRGALRHVSATLFVVGLTLTVGGQRYFHDHYKAYLNVDVSLFATNMMDSVVNQLFADIGNYVVAKLPPLAVSIAAIWLARRIARPRPLRATVAGAIAPLLLVGSFFVPTQHRHTQASLPDVLYLEAVGGLIRTQLGYTDQSKQLRPRARESLPVVLAGPRSPGTRRPNVVLVILESVRADAVCTAPGPGCRKTPYTDAAVPNRFPLMQMRSLDSCTAISLAVLWSGVGPQEPRDVLHTWPLLFDYARAAGYDTAFWTSQNMMFGNARLWVKNLGVREFVSATDLDPTSDLDMGAPEHLLAAHVSGHIDELHEPFLAVVQLSNLHYPYMVDTKGPMPFSPWTTSKAPEDNAAFFNYYLNGVHQQDRHVAAMLRHVRQSPVSDHTVIVYTSDHGEAFREHDQMGHTFTVLDEEIHVPAWIDSPRGVLTSDEEHNLRAAAEAYRFHVDLPATILDLIGVWDDPGIVKYRKRMLGQSLLRTRDSDRALPLTNCAGVWSCAFENWGYMRGSLKIEARNWDQEWHCFDVASDPLERRNLGVLACGDLKSLAMSTFTRQPGRSAN